jgi:tetratricopeptide (TPR) repeat protein
MQSHFVVSGGSLTPLTTDKYMLENATTQSLASRIATVQFVLYTTCMAPMPDQALQQALAAHRAGRLQDAERLYSAILADYPSHAYANFYLGVLNVAVGKMHESLGFFESALRTKANEARFWTGYIEALLGIDRRDQARDALRKAREMGLHDKSFNQLEERFAEGPLTALIYRLTAAFKTGDYEELQRAAMSLVEHYPQHYLGWKALGFSKLRMHNPAEALKDLLESIKLNSNDVESLRYLGETQRSLGLLHEAEITYDTAISKRPDNPELYLDLGVLLATGGRYAEAEAFYRKSIALNPTSPAFTNLGVALESLGRQDEARYCFSKAISLSPTSASAYYNLGRFLYGQDALEDAERAYRLAFKHSPENVQILVNLSETLKELGAVGEALATSNRAVAMAPTYAMAHWNRSLQNLRLGNFREGWREYEWRWKYSDFPNRERQFDRPRFLGSESLTDKRVLVYSEQGLGDTIQFCRYLKLLTERGANVLFAPQKPLERLLRSMDSKCEMVDIDIQECQFDYHSPLLSLPLAFGTDFTSIPNSSPYLHADPERIAFWERRLGRPGFKVGVCWQGNVGPLDRGRSFPLTCFYGISRIPSVRLICLHKGGGLSQLRTLPEEMSVETLGDNFDVGIDAFVDTAAVMKVCDLVITSDTAIAHLGGALGVPTWVALKAVPDWRWLLERSDSPWYPSMRLFRQQVRGDWNSIFSEMEAIIGTLV